MGDQLRQHVVVGSMRGRDLVDGLERERGACRGRLLAVSRPAGSSQARMFG
jgi:hypothetical protein